MIKTCTICKTSKEETEFYFKKKGVDLRHSRCKQCHKDRTREHNRLYTARHRKMITHFLFEYLSKHPCVFCGEADPLVLQFDHIKGTKDADVSRLKRSAANLAKVVEEIMKCQVLCANCHQRKTTLSYRGGEGIPCLPS